MRRIAVDHLPSSFSVEKQDDLNPAILDLPKAMSISNSGYAEGISATPMHAVGARNQLPWSAIFAFSAPPGTLAGTAFLISSRVLITAAHCLYTTEGWAAEALIKIGENEEIRASSFRVTAGWAGHRDLDYDVGAIILDRPLPNHDHFGLCCLETSIIESSLVHCAGFPFFKQPQSEEQTRTLVHAAGKATPLDRAIEYNFYRGGGSSGSPLWVRTAAGHRLVIAIHTRNKDPGKDIRYGVRVTQELFRCIKLWIDEAETEAVTRPSAVIRAADSEQSSSEG
jgi:V8-like Glu-specific endopeptidase